MTDDLRALEERIRADVQKQLEGPFCPKPGCYGSRRFQKCNDRPCWNIDESNVRHPANVLALLDGHKAELAAAQEYIKAIVSLRDQDDHELAAKDARIAELERERDEARKVWSEFLEGNPSSPWAKLRIAERDLVTARGHIEKLKEALRPFAPAADLFHARFPNKTYCCIGFSSISVDSFRSAATLLATLDAASPAEDGEGGK